MVGRRLGLSMLLLVAGAGLTSGGGDPGDPGKILTPDEATEDRTGGAIKIEFRVGRVGILTGFQGEGMPPHLSAIHLAAAAPLKGGGEFHVYLNGKLLEDLHRLAIDSPRHFDGALLQVTGTLRKVEVDLAGSKRHDYQMVILDLDKLRVVERHASAK